MPAAREAFRRDQDFVARLRTGVTLARRDGRARSADRRIRRARRAQHCRIGQAVHRRSHRRCAHAGDDAVRRNAAGPADRLRQRREPAAAARQDPPRAIRPSCRRSAPAARVWCDRSRWKRWCSALSAAPPACCWRTGASARSSRSRRVTCRDWTLLQIDWSVVLFCVLDDAAGRDAAAAIVPALVSTQSNGCQVEQLAARA